MLSRFQKWQWITSLDYHQTVDLLVGEGVVLKILKGEQVWLQSHISHYRESLFFIKSKCMIKKRVSFLNKEIAINVKLHMLLIKLWNICSCIFFTLLICVNCLSIVVLAVPPALLSKTWIFVSPWLSSILYYLVMTSDHSQAHLVDPDHEKQNFGANIIQSPLKLTVTSKHCQFCGWFHYCNGWV